MRCVDLANTINSLYHEMPRSKKKSQSWQSQSVADKVETKVKSGNQASKQSKRLWTALYQAVARESWFCILLMGTACESLDIKLNASHWKGLVTPDH